jgi:hypothetical protein
LKEIEFHLSRDMSDASTVMNTWELLLLWF